MSKAAEQAQQIQQDVWIEINRAHLLHNFGLLQDAAGPNTGILAVIKANAYGHGLPEVAQTLKDKAVYLGVASLHDALSLKTIVPAEKIFLFGRMLDAKLPAAVAEDFTLSVSGHEEARDIAELSGKLGKISRIHIKVDTGMGRMGIPFRDALPVIKKIAGLKHLTPEGIYTHFPSADAENGFTEKQLHDFSLLLEALDRKGIRFRYRHAANSAAALRIRTPILNLCRPGLLLYGISAISPVPTNHFKPVLSMKARVLLTKRLAAGDSAGYGRSFIAEKPVNIAVLPVGYSHGYPFRCSGRAEVLYKGKRYPVAGRVSMDYLIICLGNDTASVGEDMTLIGSSAADAITAEEIADWAGTIPYEVVTRLPLTVPRLVV